MKESPEKQVNNEVPERSITLEDPLPDDFDVNHNTRDRAKGSERSFSSKNEVQFNGEGHNTPQASPNAGLWVHMIVPSSKSR